MAEVSAAPSARRAELLDAAYREVLAHGLAGMSLRPLAAAIGSSPRVLLFLFGSKDGLVRALLARARQDELVLLDRLREHTSGDTSLREVTLTVWDWLADPGHRPLLVLWAEAYTRSLIDPNGPWAGFARGTVDEWLAVLAAAHPGAAGQVGCTLTLAVLRGALLDLLATGDTTRTTAAVHQHASALTA